MTTPFMQNIEKMLADGKDDTMLRFSLGSEYLKAGTIKRGQVHLITSETVVEASFTLNGPVPFCRPLQSV